MCGRFTQCNSREEYLAYLADESERAIPYDPAPIDRYNVSPGTKVLLLNEHNNQLHLDAVHWGYAPGWWDKAPLINARVETAASSRMFRSLWLHGRAIVFTDGWYEWKRDGNTKQPYFIHRKDGNPLLMAAIGSTPFEREDENEGFLIVTTAADKRLVDIHDRQPLILTPDAARNWLTPDTSGKEAEELTCSGSVSADELIWHAVSKAVGNVKNQGRDLISPVT